MNGNLPVPELVARKPQITEAKAALEAAQAQLENARLDLSRTQFHFPKSGRVLSSQIATGQVVQAGQSYGKVFYSDSLEISASLDSKQLQWLFESPDAIVEIEADYLGKVQRYLGKLNRSVAAIDTNTRFATVYFGFQKPPEKLLPGVFTKVTIYGPKFANIAKLPVSALQQDGTVWLVDTENRLQPFKPEIIYRESDFIAVSNLESTAEVVTSRLFGATEGTYVIID